MTLIHNFTASSYLFGDDQKFLEKSSLLIGYEKVMSLERGWSLTKNLPSGHHRGQVGSELASLLSYRIKYIF